MKRKLTVLGLCAPLALMTIVALTRPGYNDPTRTAAGPAGGTSNCLWTASYPERSGGGTIVARFTTNSSALAPTNK